MMGRKKRRRIRLLAFGGVALAAATTIGGIVFNDAIVFFVVPSQLVEKVEAGEAGPDRRLRLGGLVAEGSVQRAVLAEGSDQSVSVRFDVTDNETSLPVTFAGVLPDLFREGQGIVAEGYFRDGVFEADEVLAKHDETYMPREIADALKEQGHWKEEETY